MKILPDRCLKTTGRLEQSGGSAETNFTGWMVEPWIVAR